MNEVNEQLNTDINIINIKSAKPDYGFGGGFLTVLQNIGKSLVYPIAVLPIAALILRFGVLFESLATTENGIQMAWLYWLGFILQAPGSAIFNNLPLIFAIGVAFGFAKDHRGEAALAGAIGYLVLIALVQAEGSLTSLYYQNVMVTPGLSEGEVVYYSRLLYIVPTPESEGIWLLNLGVFGGIESGLISAYLYNRYSNVQLPAALGFFSGRRFVPMVVVVTMIFVAFITAAIWPWFQLALVEMSLGIVKIPWLGAGLYAFFNRLLIPFGLHQVLNVFFWFQMPITHNGDQVFVLTSQGSTEPVVLLGDINAYLNSGTYVLYGVTTDPTDPNAWLIGDPAWQLLQESNVGVFQTGYFPIMMGGVPAVALAIGMTADKDNRKTVITFMMSAAAISFLTGITEPVEYSFMFVSPVLYFFYAALSGIVAAATVATGISFGFGFSAGLIDLIASAPVAIHLSTTGGWSYMIMFALIIAVFPIYYFMSYYIIIWTDAATPGRNGNTLGIGQEARSELKSVQQSQTPLLHQENKLIKTDKYLKMAEDTIALVGGIEKIHEVDSCITRVRLIIEDNNISQEDAKKIGYLGYSKVGKNSGQFILGPDAEIVANYIAEIVNYKK